MQREAAPHLAFHFRGALSTRAVALCVLVALETACVTSEFGASGIFAHGHTTPHEVVGFPNLFLNLVNEIEREEAQ